MKPSREDLKQFLKFMFCSQAAWLADCGVFALAHEVFALHYILCKVLSYTTGAIVSSSLNRKITFRSCESFISNTLLKFLLVNIVSIGLSLLAMSAVVDYAGWNVWLGYFFSILFSFSNNYLGNRFWVFKNVPRGE